MSPPCTHCADYSTVLRWWFSPAAAAGSGVGSAAYAACRARVRLRYDAHGCSQHTLSESFELREPRSERRTALNVARDMLAPGDLGNEGAPAPAGPVLLLDAEKLC